MVQEVFRAGVRPGGPNTGVEIKMLLCYIMSKTQQPISFDQLYEALSEKDLVNYFELVTAVEELCATGHIARQDGVYSATPLGRQAGREFVTALPLSVREKALDAVQKLFAKERRLAELSVEIVPAKGGYQMRFAIPEGEGELVSFSLFVATKEECEAIQKRFLNAPGYIYKGVLALLTGDSAILDEEYPAPEERLF